MPWLQCKTKSENLAHILGCQTGAVTLLHQGLRRLSLSQGVEGERWRYDASPGLGLGCPVSEFICMRGCPPVDLLSLVHVSCLVSPLLISFWITAVLSACCLKPDAVIRSVLVPVCWRPASDSCCALRPVSGSPQPASGIFVHKASDGAVSLFNRL